jgi:hypothetical protein
MKKRRASRSSRHKEKPHGVDDLDTNPLWCACQAGEAWTVIGWYMDQAWLSRQDHLEREVLRFWNLLMPNARRVVPSEVRPLLEAGLAEMLAEWEAYYHSEYGGLSMRYEAEMDFTVNVKEEREAYREDFRRLKCLEHLEPVRRHKYQIRGAVWTYLDERSKRFCEFGEFIARFLCPDGVYEHMYTPPDTSTARGTEWGKSELANRCFSLGELHPRAAWGSQLQPKWIALGFGTNPSRELIDLCSTKYPASVTEVVQHLHTAVRDALIQEIEAATNDEALRESPTPRWDRLHKKLYYGNKVLRSISSSAMTLRPLIESLQAANWAPSVPNPLPDKKDVRKRRLRQAVRDFNKKCKDKPGGIRLGWMDGGEILTWRPK